MKKILLLCAVLLCAANTFAQDDIDPAGVFVFTDKDGNVYDDGVTVECNTVEFDEYEDRIQLPSGLYVKQAKGGDSFGVSMTADITSLANGSISVCFPQSCINVTAPGSYNVGKNKLSSVTSYDEDTKLAGLVTEWFPETETAYGQSTATFTLTTMEIVPGSGFIQIPSYNPLGVSRTIHVKFNFKDPTGISGVTDNAASANVTARFAADGRRISAPVKGINILKLSDGRTVKTVVR